jgi:hypothetical protein
LREINIGFNIAGKRSEFLIRADAVFGTLSFAQDVLRCFLIVPEIGLRAAGFQRLQTLAILRGVKENSALARCAA